MVPQYGFLTSFLLILQSFSLAVTAQTAPRAKTPTMGAVGIAVQSITKSQAFYTNTLGLRATGMTFNTPIFDEIVMALPVERPGSALVLMQYKTPRNTTNLPVKLVFYVEDVKATVEKIRAHGTQIVTEPGTAKYGNVTIPTAFARDVDGYLIELNPLTFL